MTTTPSVADAVCDHVEWSRSVYATREWKNIRSCLAKLVQHTDELTVPKLRRALSMLETDTKLTVNYRRKCWSTWLRFLRWRCEWGELTADVAFIAAGFRPRWKRDPDAEPRELVEPNQILDDLHKLTTLDRDIVRMLLLTAARPSELLAITSRQVLIHDDGCTVFLEHHKTAAKTERPRVLVFGHNASMLLAPRLLPFCPDDFVFPAPRDRTRQLTTNTLAQRIRRRGVTTWTLYDCRRIAARRLRERGGLDIAQAMLGHTRASTTEIYAPVDTANAAHAAQILDEAFG